MLQVTGITTVTKFHCPLSSQDGELVRSQVKSTEAGRYGASVRDTLETPKRFPRGPHLPRSMHPLSRRNRRSCWRCSHRCKLHRVTRLTPSTEFESQSRSLQSEPEYPRRKLFCGRGLCLSVSVRSSQRALIFPGIVIGPKWPFETTRCWITTFSIGSSLVSEQCSDSNQSS